eukprot:7336297-Prymnesium_polylepis.1
MASPSAARGCWRCRKRSASERAVRPTGCASKEVSCGSASSAVCLYMPAGCARSHGFFISTSVRSASVARSGWTAARSSWLLASQSSASAAQCWSGSTVRSWFELRSTRHNCCSRLSAGKIRI